MWESNAGTIWLFPNIYKSKRERKEVRRRVRKKNWGVFTEAEETEIEINVEPTWRKHIDRDVEVRAKGG